MKLIKRLSCVLCIVLNIVFVKSLYLKIQNKKESNSMEKTDMIELVNKSFEKLKDKRQNIEEELSDLEKMKINMEFVKQKIHIEQNRIVKEREKLKEQINKYLDSAKNGNTYPKFKEEAGDNADVEYMKQFLEELVPNLDNNIMTNDAENKSHSSEKNKERNKLEDSFLSSKSSHKDDSKASLPSIDISNDLDTVSLEEPKPSRSSSVIPREASTPQSVKKGDLNSSLFNINLNDDLKPINTGNSPVVRDTVSLDKDDLDLPLTPVSSSSSHKSTLNQDLSVVDLEPQLPLPSGEHNFPPAFLNNMNKNPTDSPIFTPIKNAPKASGIGSLNNSNTPSVPGLNNPSMSSMFKFKDTSLKNNITNHSMDTNFTSHSNVTSSFRNHTKKFMRSDSLRLHPPRNNTLLSTNNVKVSGEMNKLFSSLHLDTPKQPSLPLPKKKELTNEDKEKIEKEKLKNSLISYYLKRKKLEQLEKLKLEKELPLFNNNDFQKMSEIKKTLQKPFLHAKSIERTYEFTKRQIPRFKQRNFKPRMNVFGPIKPLNPITVNFSHYRNVGEQYIFGAVPNFKKREYQIPSSDLIR